MAALLVTATGLPTSPLDAAAGFYSTVVPEVLEGLANATEVVITFDPAAPAHRAWRLAAVQELAREAAPRRVNGIVGTGEKALQEVRDFLARAPGVTGQLLAVDGKSGESD